MSTAVKFPFQIVNGSVGMNANDSEAVRSKLMFCLGTQVNERAMRPRWGIDILGTAFSVGADLEEAIPEAITEAFKQWFPALIFIEASVEVIREAGAYYAVEVGQQGQFDTYAVVTVRYGQIDSETDEIIRYQLPVQDLGE